MTKLSAKAHRHWLRGTLVALVVGSPLLAVSIGASGASAASTPKTSVAATCERVADVLSDGPDPGVDPVGYALAQIRPLRAISTKDSALKKDIDNLASAYETVYKTNDKKGSETTVNKAGKKLDGICPGAF